MFTSPQEQAQRVRRARRAGTKPSAAPPGRRQAGPGPGRGRAPPPAGRSYQAARPRPGRRRPIRARLPGRTSPRDARRRRDPTARAWHRARTRTTRGSQSAAGHAQPQPRSRADLTRRPPQRGAGARTPPPCVARRARATVVPRDRVCSCPTPNAGSPRWGGLGTPTRLPTVPRLLPLQTPQEESQIKALLAMATGAGDGG